MTNELLSHLCGVVLGQQPEGFPWGLVAIGAFVILVFSSIVFVASRYRRCPSDRILVVYGKVGRGKSARCIHGGGILVWPLIQGSSYLSLTPMTISIPLENALSFQNIRINIPSTFTVGISTETDVMTNAAERLLGLSIRQIEETVREILFGQLRLTVASLTIEQINQDRESFLDAIRKNVEPELNKVGLYLINVNITDITDESEYIASIGKKAASEAINRAKIDVAEQQKLGAVGESGNRREQEIRVAENLAAAEKGKKQAEADRRIFVQRQEAEAVIGESEANRDREIRVAETQAESDKGKKKAEADRRIYVHQQESSAVGGENLAKAEIADANADLAMRQADAHKRGEVAKREALVEIQKAHYRSELERLNAEEIVRKEIDKRSIEIEADAEAERIRRVAKGEADAILMKYEAEAKGIRQVLEGKSAGYDSLVKSCDGDARSAATLLLIEKIEEIVGRQVDAIKNLKIDKITVWDSGNGNGGPGGTSTSNFIHGLVRSLPPLHELASMAGVELPGYLGKLADDAPREGAPRAPGARSGGDGKQTKSSSS